MSSLKEKLKLAAESAKILADKVAKGEDLTVPAEEYHRRMAICHGCDKFVKCSCQCGECGCMLKAKARLAGMKCPIGKW